MKKKICIIDNSVSFTGAFKCALIQTDLLRHEYDFIFIVPTDSSTIQYLEIYNIKYYTLPMIEISRSPRNLALYLPRLLQNTMNLHKIIREERISVLQMNDFYNLLGVCVKITGFKGVLITYARFLPSAVPAILGKIWIMLAQKYASALVAVSDAVLVQLRPHNKNIRIYDAIQFTENMPAKEYNQQPAQIKLLYLANYIQGKGQDHAIKAFRECWQSDKRLRLLFAGSDMGLLRNRLFKEQLQKYTVDHKITDVVSFKSFVTDIEKEIKESDIVLNFSEAESFGMTCAEAAYYGLPVIATRCGGPEEIVDHDVTGLLVENRNGEEMCTAILKLAWSPLLRKEFGIAGKQNIHRKFSSGLFLQKYKTLLGHIGLQANE